MGIKSRDEFIDYALRYLGKPFVDIDISDEQLYDRYYEALEFYHQYFPDGIIRNHFKQRLLASELKIDPASAPGYNASASDEVNLENLGNYIKENFLLSDKIVGETSNSFTDITRDYRLSGSKRTDAQFNNYDTRNLLLTHNAIREDIEQINEDKKIFFEKGEWVYVKDKPNIRLKLVDDDDYERLDIADLKYIDLPDDILGVINVLSIGQASSSKNIFDLQYQLRLNDLYDLTSTSMIYYSTVMKHLSLLDLELNGHTIHRFNRRMGRLYLDVNFRSDIILGDYIVLECYRSVNPEIFQRIWDDRYFKHYYAALLKKQWGANLKKFGGVIIAGGISYDGQAIYDEGKQEIADVENQYKDLEAPLEIFYG